MVREFFFLQNKTKYVRNDSKKNNCVFFLEIKNKRKRWTKFYVLLFINISDVFYKKNKNLFYLISTKIRMSIILIFIIYIYNLKSLRAHIISKPQRPQRRWLVNCSLKLFLREPLRSD